MLNDMMKIVPVALLAVGLAGSGAIAKDRHELINFATGSPTGGWYPIGSKIAEMTNAAYYEGQPISVVPGGGVANVLRVGTGEVGLGISYGSYLAFGQRGGNDLYETAMPDLRVLAALLPTVLHTLAAPDSGITEFADLRQGGFDVATGLRGSSELFTMERIFEAYDLSLRDYDGVELMATKGRVDAWKNRQADMVNFMINVPGAAINDLLSARGGVWVEIDDAVARRLNETLGYEVYTIPANTYPNQPDPVEAIGFPMVIFATSALDSDMAYRITRTIAENPDALRSVHAGFNNWEPEMMVRGTGIELHEGAARYYRERGWID